MTSQSSITVNELLGLVAGTLIHEDFVRIATAVKNDTGLQAQLASFERVRTELVSAMVFDKSQITVETFAENLVNSVEPAATKPENADTGNTWINRLRNLFAASSLPARFAYGLVAFQAIGIAWLVSGALQTNDDLAASTRTAGPDTKQLGTAPSSVTFSISFDPITPESTIRGLLLGLEAQIISGPSQLGQYKIGVARNRSHLTLLKLREAAFVEQVTEIASEENKPNATDGDKK